MQRQLAIRVLACLGVLLPAAHALAAVRVPVTFVEDLSPHWLAGNGGEDVPTPAAGQVLAVGELSLDADALAGPTRLGLRFPDGALHPLRIDRRSLVYEFGRLVFCRFAVDIPAGMPGQEGFALEYGDDVECANVLVAGIRLDPASRPAYREMRLGPAAGAGADTQPEPQERSLRIVADRRQGWASWLYLLPLVLVVGAVLLRAATRKRTPAGPANPGAPAREAGKTPCD